MKQIVIAATDGPKAHAFRATLLCYVMADALWGNDTSTSTVIRPAFMMLSGTDQTMRAVNANLRLGRKAILPEERGNRSSEGRRLELLKSAGDDGYDLFSQRIALAPTVGQANSETDETKFATVSTWVLPELFVLDGGMVDPKGIGFVMLPSLDWVREHTQTDPAQRAEVLAHGLEWLSRRPGPINKWEKPRVPDDELLNYVVDVAPLFVAYLDRRTRCPIHSDHKFYVQLLLACLDEGLASLSVEEGYFHQESAPFGRWKRIRMTAYGTATVNLAEPIGFLATHDDFEKLLAKETRRFFDPTTIALMDARDDEEDSDEDSDDGYDEDDVDDANSYAEDR